MFVLILICTLFVSFIVAVVFYLSGLIVKGSRKYFWARIIFSILCTCGLIYELYLHTLGTSGSDLERIYTNNFSTPLSDIHHLNGDERTWRDYDAELTFISDATPVLKYPEGYKDVPCDHVDYDVLVEKGDDPRECEQYPHKPAPDIWTALIHSTQNTTEPDTPDQQKYDFCVYDFNKKKAEELLPSLQCRDGHTKWIDPNIAPGGDCESELVYNTHTHQTLFRERCY